MKNTSAPTRPLPPIDRFLSHRPDIAIMAPYLSYLLLLGIRDSVPLEYAWLASLVRGVGALLVAAVVWKHLPPLGRPHWGAAITVGVLAALGWYYGHLLALSTGLPQRLPLPLFGGTPELVDPRAATLSDGTALGAGGLFWLNSLTRVAVAVVTVPLVEELFWRAFLLRALIDWNNFENLPLGKFTWFSFLGTSLLSTVQHPDHWVVSIFCWFAFNALMYWKKSILCLVICHGVTNLVLYAWVLFAGLALGDARAWWLW
jgi:membrane protease YdiL (CAAX protease family)